MSRFVRTLLALLVAALAWLALRPDAAPTFPPADAPDQGAHSTTTVASAAPHKPTAVAPVERQHAGPSVAGPSANESRTAPRPEVVDAEPLPRGVAVSENLRRRDAEAAPIPTQGSCRDSVSPDGFVFGDTVELFDLTPQEAFGYREPAGAESRNALVVLRRFMNAYACDLQAWPDDYPTPRYEWVLITARADFRMYVGEHWMGDGVRLVPIDAGDFAVIEHLLEDRRRLSVGRNMTREEFERYLEQRRRRRNG